jgi:hypothetical protein
MAKIYVKTIVLVVLVVIMALFRMNLLTVSILFPAFLLDTLIGLGIVAVVINEKLTKGEHWHTWHYAFSLVAFILILCLRLLVGKIL